MGRDVIRDLLAELHARALAQEPGWELGTPREPGSYLVTFAWADGHRETGEAIWDGRKYGYWASGPCRVVAWKPMPRPYLEVE